MLSAPPLPLDLDLQTLVEQQQHYVNFFFDSLDRETLVEQVRLFQECEGIVYFTGIGKSGIVAQKLAMTLTSTGTKAFFLSSVDALHGDLGMLDKKDLFVILSKSGESDELLRLVPFVRNKNVKTVAWVSKEESRLSKACDFVAHLPLERELCPFNLAPTTSPALQMLYGDLLAVALMKVNGVTANDFAENHPAGRIGKRLTYRVRDVMLTGENIPLCHQQDRVLDLLVPLSDKRCGCLLIHDGSHRLLGIFTDGDLRRCLLQGGSAAMETPVEQFMSTHPKWIRPDALALEAMRLMEEDSQHPVTVLPVLEKGRIVGLVRMHDIVQTGI